MSQLNVNTIKDRTARGGGGGAMSTLEVNNITELDGTTRYAKIATGSYTGDGTTGQSITGLGFQPVYVKASRSLSANGTLKVFTTTDVIVDDNASGGALVETNTAGNEHLFQTDRIISLDSDGFTVDDNGADDDPNANGVTYNYIAFGY